MGVGVAVAPLWAAFFAAAGAGVTYWWMTAWTRRQIQAAPAEPKSFAPDAEVVTAQEPEPLQEPAADVATETLAVAPQEILEHAPVEAAPVIAEALPAEIASADPVERALEAGKDAAEAKPRKTSRKAKA